MKQTQSEGDAILICEWDATLICRDALS